MRSKNKTALIFIFIFSLILLISLVSCKMSNNKQDKNKDTQVILYFIDGDKSQLK